jgi:geranylgeranyl diphosphate synthase, type I
VAEPIHFADVIDTRLRDFFRKTSVDVQRISADLVPLVEYSEKFLTGGKRFRARFCFWGWRAVAGLTPDDRPAHTDHPIFDLASALEVFHAAALVHDDIMDNSDTRRGEPSAHRFFESHHASNGFAGNASHYGNSTALLVGDLLLAWSDELLNAALLQLGPGHASDTTRSEYARMRSEVTLGQYLDIHEEAAWRHSPESSRFDRSLRVITYKSAKYSMEAPLRLGASLAGASPTQLDQLSAFGLPLGIAFQLRDDILGVFGDPEVTGKPSGDDLREGKRTVLIALAEEKMSPSARSVFADMLGDRDLTDEQIAIMQTTLHDTGAVERVETIISDSVQQAMAALRRAEISPEAATELGRLADAVTKRLA